MVILQYKDMFLRATVRAFRTEVLPGSHTPSLKEPEGYTAASGVESTHIRGKETAALMPRKNLLSLFADFARFGGDVAVMQRRGYRREKLTYTELYADALFWNYALAGRRVVPGDRGLLWGPHSPQL